MMTATAPRLEREMFRTSRLLEFCSQKELVVQTGHHVGEWPLVMMKELTDNAIDIAEEIGVAPRVEIVVSTETGEIVVADNGPGIRAATVDAILDYAIRVRSREAYVSPTREAQGNALKTVHGCVGAGAPLGTRQRRRRGSVWNTAPPRIWGGGLPYHRDRTGSSARCSPPSSITPAARGDGIARAVNIAAMWPL